MEYCVVRMQTLSLILSVGLMIPFLAWGIYTLRVRFQFHEDFAPRVEAMTLVFIAVFLTVEFVLLRTWMTNSPVLYLFSIMGLIVSSTALYGAMLVSLASRLLVDLVSQAEPTDSDTPHYGPAESLELTGDHEGALQEYLVIARIYPKDASATLRIASSLTKLSRYSEATEFFEKALNLLRDEERALRITNRLSDIYHRQLNRSDDAVRVLENYQVKYPDSSRLEAVQKRLTRIRDAGPTLMATTPEGVPPKDLSV